MGGQNMKRIIALSTIALYASGCSVLLDPQLEEGQGKIDGTIKAAFLYVGPVGDHGWTKAHDVSREYILNNVPDVQAEFTPTVAAADAEKVISDYVAGGSNVILATSFDFLNPVLSSAANNPDVNFLICSGFKTTPNLGSYFGRMYQVMYMAGVLAARTTKTKRVGIVGPVVIPETVRHINAFTRGVRSVDASIKVHVSWVKAWFNPPVETSAAQELVRAGADVIFGHTDTTIPIEVATATNTPSGDKVYAIGYDNPDSCRFDKGPDTFGEPRCLTSAFWNWGPMVTRELTKMREGTWNPKEELVWESMKSTKDASVAYLADINTDIVPSEDRLAVEQLIPQLAQETDQAKQLPFKGPVTDNNGTVRLQAGQSFTDNDLLRMCWFVEGVYDAEDNLAVVPSECIGDN